MDKKIDATLQKQNKATLTKAFTDTIIQQHFKKLGEEEDKSNKLGEEKMQSKHILKK